MVILSEMVGRTVNDFLNYALFIVSIMIIYYIVKFFFAAPPSKEERQAEREARQEQFSNWFTEKKEAMKKKKAQEQRQTLVRYPRAYLVQAIEHCDDLTTALGKKDKDAAYSTAKSERKELISALAQAVHYVRRMRRREEGQLHQYLDRIYSYSGTALQKARDLEIPSPDDAERDNGVRQVQQSAQQIRRICGSVIESLDQYLEQAATELPQQVSGQARRPRTARLLRMAGRRIRQRPRR